MKKFVLPSLALALVTAFAPLASAEEKAAATPKTVVDVAVANDDFSTLVTAVKAAGLAEALMGKGPFTVFAPTNEAFAKVDKAALASLLKPENKDKLAALLKYHVVAGKVTAADVVKLNEAEALSGEKIAIEVKDGKVMLNGKATVIKTDIMAGNGIIHVIDQVIMPTK